MSATISDAELRCFREDLGMPAVVLADLTGYKVDDIALMEHGEKHVPQDLVNKIHKIQDVTSKFIDQLVTEGRHRGYITTARFNGELSAMYPEYADFGSMWHRACALRASEETNLPIQYGPKRSKIRIA